MGMFIDIREESMIRPDLFSGRETVNFDASPLTKVGGFSVGHHHIGVRSLSSLGSKTTRKYVQPRAESKEVLSSLCFY